jgi:hypothetical protein
MWPYFIRNELRSGIVMRNEQINNTARLKS